MKEARCGALRRHGPVQAPKQKSSQRKGHLVWDAFLSPAESKQSAAFILIASVNENRRKGKENWRGRIPERICRIQQTHDKQETACGASWNQQADMALRKHRHISFMILFMQKRERHSISWIWKHQADGRKAPEDRDAAPDIIADISLACAYSCLFIHRTAAVGGSQVIGRYQTWGRAKKNSPSIIFE